MLRCRVPSLLLSVSVSPFLVLRSIGQVFSGMFLSVPLSDVFVMIRLGLVPSDPFL